MSEKTSAWPPNGPILLIDDEPLLLAARHRLLEARGCSCLVAQQHKEALQLLQSHCDIALVILDWDMPGEDPSLLVPWIRTLRPDLLVIGNSGRDRQKDFAAIGVRHYLEKPWNLDELISFFVCRR